MQGRPVTQVRKLAVAHALNPVVTACCGQHGILRVKLIRAFGVARTGVGDGVLVAGAALSGD